MSYDRESVLDQFLASGGSVVRPGSVDYPESIAVACRLRNKDMPTLYIYGSSEPLHTPGIGLCGSRHVSDIGWGIAAKLGNAVAECGASLVSGYASGVDTAGHVSAIRSGGQTTAVLAEGLAKFRWRSDYQDCHEAEQLMTVVSQFELQSRWSTINAMTRNFTICALSSALIAIEPGEKGGTLNAAQEGLRQEKPVFVVARARPTGSAPATDRLLKRGAILIEDEYELRDVVNDLQSKHDRFSEADQPQLF